MHEALDDRFHNSQAWRFAYMVSCLLEIAELLAPFMPDTSTKIVNIFETGIVQPTEGTLFPKHDRPESVEG